MNNDKLITKYRPKTLDEVFGNVDVVESLGVAKDVHSFLFFGDSGCGKTTLARIMANNLGCDIYDINCADESGRENIRNIIDKIIPYKPLSGKNIALIFDECHALSTAAQQTLLKVVEDCPHHIYFFFCSTEPTKIIPTLKNRLVKYQINKLQPKEILSFVEKIWEAEGLPKDWEKVQRLIAKKSKGVPREALSLIARAIGQDYEVAILSLDEEQEESGELSELAKCLMKTGTTWGSIIDEYKKLKDKYDDETIRTMLVGYYKGWLTNANKRTEDIAFALKKLLSFPEGRFASANLILAFYLIWENNNG